jgi:hypothetical protein
VEGDGERAGEDFVKIVAEGGTNGGVLLREQEGFGGGFREWRIPGSLHNELGWQRLGGSLGGRGFLDVRPHHGDDGDRDVGHAVVAPRVVGNGAQDLFVG